MTNIGIQIARVGTADLHIQTSSVCEQPIEYIAQTADYLPDESGFCRSQSLE
jgi:hypothetical protein